MNKGVCMKVARVVPVNFRAGKVHLFSDFDGTYCPIRKKELTGKNPVNIDSYCRDINKFLNKTNDSLDFHITTGRNFDSYKRIMEFLNKQNVHLPMPDSLITENGKYEYKKIGTDKDFFEQNKFPYDASKHLLSSEHRLEESKRLGINYAPDKLYDAKKSIIDAVKNKDIVIVCGDGTNDFNMLNPLNYIDLKKYEEKSENKSFFQGRMHKKLSDLKAVLNGENSEYINKLRQEFKSNGLLKELETLPLYCVLIDRNDKADLKPIEEAFLSLNKVVKMEKGDWSKTLKSIIKKHAQKDKEFRKAMTFGVKNYIFGKLSVYNPYLSVPAAVAGIIGAGCFIFKLADKKAV